MTEETPPLPPDPELLNRQPKWFMPVFKGVIVATILSVLAALSSPMMLRSAKKSPKGEAISNAKQIGLALFEFEQDYEAYPNSETAKVITDAFPYHGQDLTGNSSNALFRQLLAAGIVPSEEIFYAKTRTSKKPDGNITPGEALNKGEVGFAYISGLSSKDDPLTPIVITPLIPGTKKFDPDAFDGSAIVLHVDMSARTYKIRKDGTIHDKDGDLLSPKHPIWKGKAPTIHYPE